MTQPRIDLATLHSQSSAAQIPLPSNLAPREHVGIVNDSFLDILTQLAKNEPTLDNAGPLQVAPVDEIEQLTHTTPPSIAHAASASNPVSTLEPAQQINALFSASETLVNHSAVNSKGDTNLQSAPASASGPTLDSFDPPKPYLHLIAAEATQSRLGVTDQAAQIAASLIQPVRPVPVIPEKQVSNQLEAGNELSTKHVVLSEFQDADLISTELEPIRNPDRNPVPIVQHPARSNSQIEIKKNSAEVPQPAVLDQALPKVQHNANRPLNPVFARPEYSPARLDANDPDPRADALGPAANAEFLTLSFTGNRPILKAPVSIQSDPSVSEQKTAAANAVQAVDEARQIQASKLVTRTEQTKRNNHRSDEPSALRFSRFEKVETTHRKSPAGPALTLTDRLTRSNATSPASSFLAPGSVQSRAQTLVESIVTQLVALSETQGTPASPTTLETQRTLPNPIEPLTVPVASSISANESTRLEANSDPITKPTEHGSARPVFERSDFQTRLLHRIALAFESNNLSKEPVSFRIKIPQLGVVDIDVQINSSILSASIFAESQSTRQLISDHLGDLRSRLSGYGLGHDQIDIQVREPSGSDAASEDPGQEQQQLPRSPRLPRVAKTHALNSAFEIELNQVDLDAINIHI